MNHHKAVQLTRKWTICMQPISEYANS